MKTSSLGWALGAALVVLGSGAWGAPPRIGQTPDPAWGGESMVIAGDGFLPGKTEFRVWSPQWDQIDKEQAQRAGPAAAAPVREQEDPAVLQAREAEARRAFNDRLLAYLGQPRPALPPAPPANSQVCTVLSCTSQLATIEFPRYTKYSGGPAELYCAVLYAGDKESGWSNPWVVDATRANFLTASQVVRGEAVRVIGRNLGTFFGAGPLVALRQPQTGAKLLCPLQPIYYGHFGYNRYYDWQFVVPVETPPGDYEVWTHNTTGEYLGWSGPLALRVVAPGGPRRRIVNAKDFGVVGDGEADDTAALQKALDAAGRAAPALLTLPMGTYKIVETVSIPDGVTMRGQGLTNTLVVSSEDPPFRGEPKPISGLGQSGDQPAWKIFYVMLHGKTNFALEDLCLRGAGESAGVLLAVSNGRDKFSEDVRFTRCRFVNESKAATPVTGIVSARPSDGLLATKFWKGVLGDRVRRLRIEHCEFQDASTWFSYMDQCYFGYNRSDTAHWLSGGQALSLGVMARNCMQEQTLIVGPRGICGGGRKQNCYISDNRVEKTVTADGEAYLLEGSGQVWYGKPTFVDETHLKTPGEAWRTQGFDFSAINTEDRPLWLEQKSRDLTDHYVVITNGKGLGQYRRIASAQGDTITLAEPWGVVPDATSEAAIEYGSVENVLVNNMGFDTNGTTGGLFGAGAMNTLIDGTFGRDAAGPYIWSFVFQAAGRADGLKFTVVPDYFNQIVHGRWSGKGNIFLTDGVNGRFDNRELGAYPQIGTLVMKNEVLYPRNLGWGASSFMAPGLKPESEEDPERGKFPAIVVSGKITCPLIEENLVRAANVGVWISPLATGTIVRRNTFAEIEYEMVKDLGTASLIGAPTTKTQWQGYWPQGYNLNLLPGQP